VKDKKNCTSHLTMKQITSIRQMVTISTWVKLPFNAEEEMMP